MANGMKYVEGAMKDVLTLSNLYDDLKENIVIIMKKILKKKKQGLI